VSTSPYADLGRPPFREAALRRAVIAGGGLWTDLRVVAETGSTNADLAAAARDGAPEGSVLVAERQTAGRGRLGRQWESPPRAGLAVSVLLRPEEVPVSRYGWLPLLAGIALAEAVRKVSDVDAYLKWPNDLLLPGDRKCGGILAEVVAPGAVVLGIGLNVTLREDELPRPDATSLLLAGAANTDRDPLLRQLLRSLAIWYGRWRTGDIREEYLLHCGTIGRRVRIELPGSINSGGMVSGGGASGGGASGGIVREGVAADIDGDGRLVVTTEDGQVTVAAGDVVHVR
jgi:BirA family transcriptional regulator, biotin operon repressor / biotin---[acetyl-CoA-carboxylase] ligase